VLRNILHIQLQYLMLIANIDSVLRRVRTITIHRALVVVVTVVIVTTMSV